MTQIVRTDHLHMDEFFRDIGFSFYEETPDYNHRYNMEEVPTGGNQASSNKQQEDLGVIILRPTYHNRPLDQQSTIREKLKVVLRLSLPTAFVNSLRHKYPNTQNVYVIVGKPRPSKYEEIVNKITGTDVLLVATMELNSILLANRLPPIEELITFPERAESSGDRLQPGMGRLNFRDNTVSICIKFHHRPSDRAVITLAKKYYPEVNVVRTKGDLWKMSVSLQDTKSNLSCNNFMNPYELVFHRSSNDPALKKASKKAEKSKKNKESTNKEPKEQGNNNKSGNTGSVSNPTHTENKNQQSEHSNTYGNNDNTTTTSNNKPSSRKPSLVMPEGPSPLEQMAASTGYPRRSIQAGEGGTGPEQMFDSSYLSKFLQDMEQKTDYGQHNNQHNNQHTNPPTPQPESFGPRRQSVPCPSIKDLENVVQYHEPQVHVGPHYSLSPNPSHNTTPYVMMLNEVGGSMPGSYVGTVPSIAYAKTVRSINPTKCTDLGDISKGEVLVDIKGENMPLNVSIYFDCTKAEQLEHFCSEAEKWVKTCVVPPLVKVIKDRLESQNRKFETDPKVHGFFQQKGYTVSVTLVDEVTGNNIPYSQSFTYVSDSNYFNSLWQQLTTQKEDERRTTAGGPQKGRTTNNNQPAGGAYGTWTPYSRYGQIYNGR